MGSLSEVYYFAGALTFAQMTFRVRACRMEKLTGRPAAPNFGPFRSICTPEPDMEPSEEDSNLYENGKLRLVIEG